MANHRNSPHFGRFSLRYSRRLDSVGLEASACKQRSIWECNRSPLRGHIGLMTVLPGAQPSNACFQLQSRNGGTQRFCSKMHLSTPMISDNLNKSNNRTCGLTFKTHKSRRPLLSALHSFFPVLLPSQSLPPAISLRGCDTLEPLSDMQTTSSRHAIGQDSSQLRLLRLVDTHAQRALLHHDTHDLVKSVGGRHRSVLGIRVVCRLRVLRQSQTPNHFLGTKKKKRG